MAQRNLLDRVIGYVSPERGLARDKARATSDAVAVATRSYDGARQKRETWGWAPSGSDANSDVRQGLDMMRRRSRDLIQNSPWGVRARDILVSNEVGTGIRPRSKSGSVQIDKRRMKMWAAWAEKTVCDLESRMDIYGLQSLANSGRIESGDALVRLVKLSSEEMRAFGSPIPLQLQLLEGDYLCTAQDGIVQPNGHQIIQGIEVDPAGRRVAYMLWKAHPGNGFPHPQGWIRVPAEEIVHLFHKERPGMVRGVPKMHAIIERLGSSQDFEDAVQMRAKIEACMVLFVTQEGNDTAPSEVGDSTIDQDGQRVESVSPGQVNYLRANEKVTSVMPSASSGQVQWMQHNLRAAAMGVGVCADQLSGDLSGASYSSLRAGRLEFNRLVEQTQWLCIIPGLCQPLWDAFCRAGALAGLWPVDAPTTCEWHPPLPQLLDPVKDTAALVSMVRAGFRTQAQAIEASGYNADEQLEQIAAMNATLDDLGIELDTDPRKMSQQGQVQVSGAPPDKPKVTPGDEEQDGGDDSGADDADSSAENGEGDGDAS